MQYIFLINHYYVVKILYHLQGAFFTASIANYEFTGFFSVIVVIVFLLGTQMMHLHTITALVHKIRVDNDIKNLCMEIKSERLRMLGILSVLVLVAGLYSGSKLCLQPAKSTFIKVN